MKKVSVLFVFAVFSLILTVGCEAESTSEIENIYGIDKDKTIPPGSTDNESNAEDDAIDKDKTVPPGGN